MKIKLFIVCALFPLMAAAQSFEFDMTKPQPIYNDSKGFGYDVLPVPGKSVRPFYFSVKVPDGNYKVTVILGSKKRDAQTVVRAESRRLFVENAETKRGKYQTYQFVVNKRSPQINDLEVVKIKPREKNYLNWDDRLTLEFNGKAPAVRKIIIERDNVVPTVFLCGNSTVVDQNEEPWASWGQMIPRWFNENIAISNQAESGLTAGSFLFSNRLDKILSMLKAGDYVICEFGHNDQKEHQPGDGAWYNFSRNLKIFIDKVRAAGGIIIFVTPTQRRFFDETHTKILETHGDYPAAMMTVAKREGVQIIDLHSMTRTFFETLGYENSKRALVYYPANTFPRQNVALEDNTHFNPYGAYEVAKMVIMGMKKLELPILQNLRSDFRDFDPSKPDDFKTFRWYPAVLNRTTKPDGN